MRMPELPDVGLVRRRIKGVGRADIRAALQLIYLTGARSCEVAGRSSPSDTSTAMGPTPADVSVESFNSEQFAVFNLQVAKKRSARSRAVAVPLSERYEPMTKEVVDYFELFRGVERPVFPFSRQRLFQASQKVFENLTYRIDGYRIVREEEQERGKETLRVQIDVAGHWRAFRLHGLRNLRIHELFTFFNMSPLQTCSYIGWSPGSMYGGPSSLMARYGHLDWQSYAEKLLKPRPPARLSGSTRR